MLCGRNVGVGVGVGEFYFCLMTLLMLVSRGAMFYKSSNPIFVPFQPQPNTIQQGMRVSTKARQITLGSGVPKLGPYEVEGKTLI